MMRTAIGQCPQLVFGYTRSGVDRPGFLEACREALETWCSREGWELGAVFTDVCSALDTEDRVGFRGLLGAVTGPKRAAAVVLVDGGHLSWQADVVTELVAQIRRTGAAVRIMDGGLPPAAARLCTSQRGCSS
ncbi:hypothetical protein [Alloactinosynnema sp. L-07]|nr:hypothetical protein [Alloactinosynnema sp. L-07]